MKLPIQANSPLPKKLQEQIQLVQSQLQLEETSNPEGTFFVYDENGLSLQDEEFGLLHLDFVGDSANYSRAAHRGKSELIAKAVGLAKGHKRVFDATLGLAQDAWFLTQLGAEVEGCERSPVVYLLLVDALERSGETKLRIHYGDSVEKLKSLQGFSTVFVDPMFPEKKKSALPRKEMRIFRKWVGEDLDAQDLLQAALGSSAERVVVKRPLKAPALQNGVIHSFAGKTVRYDLYSPLVGRTV
jgi:16S rRNA (guanine1516-N2)-methyltransferase